MAILMGVGVVTNAQNNPPVTIPQGHFLTDSFEVGRPFRFALSFRHSVTEDVVFPDSTGFAPFLVRKATFLPTRTDAGISADSAVYTLVSFDTKPQQTLQVPVYVVGTTDCTTVYSSTDTIFFRSKLQTARPDTLRLQTVTEVIPLRQQLNYPVLLYVLAILGLVAALLYGLFGRFITKQGQLLQLRQNHRRFLRQYNRLINTVTPETAADVANEAVVWWKAYVERLEQQPFTTMTTPEIVRQISDQAVGGTAEEPLNIENALKTTDRVIYGGTFTEESYQALRLLRTVAVNTYYKRRRLVQNQPSAPIVVTQPASAA